MCVRRFAAGREREQQAARRVAVATSMDSQSLANARPCLAFKSTSRTLRASLDLPPHSARLDSLISLLQHTSVVDGRWEFPATSKSLSSVAGCLNWVCHHLSLATSIRSDPSPSEAMAGDARAIAAAGWHRELAWLGHQGLPPAQPTPWLGAPTARDGLAGPAVLGRHRRAPARRGRSSFPCTFQGRRRWTNLQIPEQQGGKWRVWDSCEQCWKGICADV
jgi:hypothetical protein